MLALIKSKDLTVKTFKTPKLHKSIIIDILTNIEVCKNQKNNSKHGMGYFVKYEIYDNIQNIYRQNQKVCP